MGKIVFMATSDSSLESVNSFIGTLKDTSGVRVLRAALDNAVYIARGFDPREVDALVVRGNTASALSRARLPFPVIPIMVGTEEIAQAFNAARSLVGKEKPLIGVSGFEQSISNIKALLSLSGIEIIFYHISGIEDIRTCVESALRDKVDVMISGKLCTEECRRRGMPAVEMGTSVDSIRLAYNQALEFQKSAMRQRVLSEEESLLSRHAPEVLIAVDAGGSIVSANGRAGMLLNRPPENLRGLPLTETAGFRRLGLDGIARIADDGSTAVIAHGRDNYAVTAQTVAFPQGNGGYVLRLQPVSDIQRMEQSIRRVLSPPPPACPDLDSMRALGLFAGDTIAHAAARTHSHASLLLISEPGCGAEQLAHSIHLSGPRSALPFVSCDCRTFDGAADAERRMAALFEQAHRGTLFLNCISALPVRAQLAAASAAISGGTLPCRFPEMPAPADVRLIAAATPALYSEMCAGTICRELYYALSADIIVLPPLREHAEDIASAFVFFLSVCARSAAPPLSDGCRAELASHPWRGNLRQLYALARSIAAQSPMPELTPQLLRRRIAQTVWLERSGASPADAARAADSPPIDGEPYVMVKNSVLSRSRLESVLRRNGGSRSLAAAELGMSRTSLWKCMKELSID